MTAADVVLSALTAALVLVTIWYAVTTGRIARETRELAVITKRMADEVRQQRLDATLPVIAFRKLGWAPGSESEAGQMFSDEPTASHFAVTLVNAGSGPALDIRIAVTDSPIPYTRRRRAGQDEFEPIALPAGGTADIAFRPEGAREITFEEYQKVKRTSLAGTLSVTYRDLHGRPMRSEAQLRAHQEGLGDHFLELGPLLLGRPGLEGPNTPGGPLDPDMPATALPSARQAEGSAAEPE